MLWTLYQPKTLVFDNLGTRQLGQLFLTLPLKFYSLYLSSKKFNEFSENHSYRGQQPARQQERQQGRISWLQMSKTNLEKVRRVSQRSVTSCGEAEVSRDETKGNSHTQKKKRKTKEKQPSRDIPWLLGFLDQTVPSVSEPEAFIAPEDEQITANHNLITSNVKTTGAQPLSRLDLDVW